MRLTYILNVDISNMITKDQENIIRKVLSPFQPKEIGIFGSYSRNENDSDSDLDILVSSEKRINLFEFIGIEQELSDQLGIKVDLVTRKSLSPLIRSIVEQDLQMIA
jgi:predicted nucleotidyltransferase